MQSLNQNEVDKFENMANKWWDVNGPSKPLHKLNPTRISHIEQTIKNHFQCDGLNKLNILDVGCGGGLVCEPLSQLGANVTGIDAGAQAIEVATSHAKDNGLDIKYEQSTVEDHKQTYDVVLALEIIEHVDNPDAFIQSVCERVKPNGLVITSTLNRTAKSFALGIVAAEYLLRWVPRGTHEWKKFIKPSEIARTLECNSMQIDDITGLIYNPFLDHFSLSMTDIDMNYFITASHKK